MDGQSSWVDINASRAMHDWSGDSLQVITVKSRFIADNQTDMDIEIKQKGTPDIGDGPGAVEGRCAVRLKPRER